MTRFLIAILFALFANLLSAQKVKFMDRWKWDSTHVNQPIYGQVGYNIPLASNFNGGGYGLQFAVGWNVAFAFSQKWTVGCFVGLKLKEFVPFARYKQPFGNEFGRSLHYDNGVEHDSILLRYTAFQVSDSGYNGAAMHSQIGIMIGYANRWVPLLKISRVFMLDAFEAYEYDGVYSYDFEWFYTNKALGISASWKLFCIRGAPIYLSTYFVTAKLRTMSVGGLWLHNYLDDDFQKKYQNVWRAGITLGIEFY